MNFHHYLSGGDLRSIGRSGELLKIIKTQEDFDNLFAYLRSSDRILAMRAADVIEKLSASKPQFLDSHADDILELASLDIGKEIKWHIAQIIPRVKIDEIQKAKIREILLGWAKNMKESKIVRANSLQSLYELSKDDNDLSVQFNKVIKQIKQENIPSLNARIKQMMLTGNN
jgi:hypothetical protein